MHARIRGLLWPRMGWRRTVLYHWHRLHRMPGTSRSIAAGFACGAAAAITPFYGLHIPLAIVLAWIIGANLVSAALGTLLANPWTAPPLWFITYYAGFLLLGREMEDSPPNFVHMFKELTEAILDSNMRMFVESIWPVLMPMTVGSLPLALAVGLGTYIALEPLIRRVHVRRAERISHGRRAPESEGTAR